MNSKPFAAGVLAVASVAAAGGAYFAVRQNAAPAPVVSSVPAPAPEPPAAKPVSETEAVIAKPAVTPEPAAPVRATSPAPLPVEREAARPASVAKAEPSRDVRPAPRNAAPVKDRAQPAPVTPAPSVSPAPAERPAQDAPVTTPPVDPLPEPVRQPEAPPAPPEPQYEEVVIPAASVIGILVDTPLSSERSRIEDRVDARVTRDVSAAGHVAIPAGARVIGSVTLVERGGKVKERARLGVRFHTLVLADGREIPLRTEAIFREGASPSNESARKIGGAAIGGAILGAIMGGGKGAVMGGAAGAAGGSAAVMAGDRNAATLPAGTVVTVRLTAPATIDVERRE